MLSPLLPTRLTLGLALLAACRSSSHKRPDLTTAHEGGSARSLGDLRLAAAKPWRSEVLFSTRALDSLPLGHFVDARFRPDSSLVVARETQLLVFSPAGRLLRTVGRDGDGPGEYRRIWRLAIAEDSILLISDFASGRLTLLGAGAPRVIPYLGWAAPTHEVEPLTLLANHQILATYWQRRPNRDEVGLPTAPFARDSAPLLLFDSAGTLRATLGVWPGLERALVSLNGSPAHLPPAYARSVLSQGRGRYTAITLTDSLDLTLYADTTPILRLTAATAGGPPSAADLTAWREALSADYPDVAPLYWRAIQAASPAPRRPALAGLGLSPDGQVWLGLAVAAPDTLRPWLLVSAAGHPLGHVDLPATHLPAIPGQRELLDVLGPRMALLRETPDGEPYVEVRRLLP